MRILLTALATYFMTGFGAVALEGLTGPFLYEGGPSVGTCTMLDGNYFCFNLGCNAGASPYFALLSGAPPFGGDAALIFDIGGKRLSPLMLSTDHPFDGDYFIWVAPYDMMRDRDIIMVMDRGQSGQALLAGPGGHVKWRVDFSESRGKLGQTLRGCAAPGEALIAPTAGQEPMPAEAVRILETLHADCARSGGILRATPEFAARPDLNGDGRADLVVDYGAVDCSSSPSFYCGSAGCDHVGFLAQDDGSLRQIFHSLIRGYAVSGPGLVAFFLHGSSCGLIGAETCEKIYRVFDDRLELVR